MHALTSAIVGSAKESAVANAALLAVVMTAICNNLLYDATLQYYFHRNPNPNPNPKFLKFELSKK
jgi:hypothetical protein